MHIDCWQMIKIYPRPDDRVKIYNKRLNNSGTFHIIKSYVRKKKYLTLNEEL